ncbi:MAG: type VI secretion system tip protein TssI/VgrG [Polyangiaceae bacterium]
MAQSTELKLICGSLPPDASVVEFRATEALSTLYEVEVTFITKDAAFVVEDLLRAGATLTIDEQELLRFRPISGIVDRAEFLHHDGQSFFFKIRLRPPLAALTQREDNRIYQNKSVVDVIQEVLQAAGVSKYEWRNAETYPPREYIVQYRETEFNFVSRLMEEEGIFYWFEHVDGEAVMIFADGPEPVKREMNPPVILSLAHGTKAPDSLKHFSRTHSIRTGSVHLLDYDFEKPQAKPEATQFADTEFPTPFFEYPGNFTKSADGARLATARIRELRNDVDVVQGESHCCVLEVGAAFTVDGSRQASLAGRFVITRLETHGHAGRFGGSNGITNRFHGIPEGQSWAAPRTAKKPRIGGLQTATVMGPTGGEQEIHVDKYGRIKVRFHWDRVGQRNDQASCWIRVTQVPLGGSIILPRVSWEVAVAFLEGDPDRPVVLGRVYNAEKTPPYALPATQTSGSLKSMSTPGAAGHNEISLADSGGSQGFSTHAQKDLNITIGNNKTEHVGVNESVAIKVNQSVSIGSNQTTSVGGNQAITIGANSESKIGGNESITVGGNETFNATKNNVEKIGVDRTYDVGGMSTIISNTVLQKIAGNLTRDVGAAMVSMSIASLSCVYGGDYNETVSLVKIELCKGSVGDTVTGSLDRTAVAAILHVVKGDWGQSCDGNVTSLIGGLHYSKVAGDYSVKGSMVTLLGAVGAMKGGGSELKFGGGPILMKGTKIVWEGGLLAHMSTALKLG